MTLLIFFVERP